VLGFNSGGPEHYWLPTTVSWVLNPGVPVYSLPILWT